VGLHPASAGQILYTTVVETDADLRAALETNSGDTFIKAGTYTLEVDTLVIDDTPRTFQGAGLDAVRIELTSSGGPGAIDVSGSLTSSDGVTFKDLTLFSSEPAIGPGFLVGAFVVENVRCEGTSGTSFTGFFFCSNLVNCIATGFDVFGSSGFFACAFVNNCVIDGYASDGFSLCFLLSNCNCIALDTIGIVLDTAAYQSCVDMIACSVDYTATTTVSATCHMAFACSRVSVCEFFASLPGLVGLQGVTGCDTLSSVTVRAADTGMGACSEVASCHVFSSIVSGFIGCDQVAGCLSEINGDNGYLATETMSGCQGRNNTLAGFEQCFKVSGCSAEGNTTHGYSACENVSASDAIANDGDGFNACLRVAAVSADGNTGFGYANACDRISSAAGAGNVAGLSDASNTAVDPVTAVGI